MFNQTDFIDTHWGHLFQTFNQGWSSRPVVQTFNSIYRQRAALDNMCGVSFMIKFILFADWKLHNVFCVMDTDISCVEISVCCNTEWNKIRVEGRNRYCLLYTISIHLQDLSQVWMVKEFVFFQWILQNFYGQLFHRARLHWTPPVVACSGNIFKALLVP